MRDEYMPNMYVKIFIQLRKKKKATLIDMECMCVCARENHEGANTMSN